ncbi:MAG: hypothetical protein QW542_03200 [Thermoproteota archaeon]
MNKVIRLSAFIRSVYYFKRPGPSNTRLVIEAVKKRLESGDVRLIVVPVTTGKTLEMFTQELSEDVEIKAVSEDETLVACRSTAYLDKGLLGTLIRSRIDEGLGIIDRKSRREIFEITFLPFCGEKWEALREVLYAFGQGMKVAIEISVAAVEVGKVKPYTKVISIGGMEEGADTAIVVKTSPQREAFGGVPEKRLYVHEIIAMPVEKWAI